MAKRTEDVLVLRELTVGPIIGETTPRRARIWGRADSLVIDGLPRRCFGAIHYREKPDEGQEPDDWSSVSLVKMNPNFDMTGVAVLSGLSPETEYEFEYGFYFSDVEMPDATFTKANWSQASRGSFVTASDDPKKPRTIVIGSCRYLLKTFFGSAFDDRGDKTFRSILEQIKVDKTELHQLLMMGDQIYADDMNFLFPDKNLEQFYARYRDAFTQRYIRELMGRVPTYMTLDDHEIEDNWPAKASEKDRVRLYPVAIHAYQAYQVSHGPSIPIRKDRLEGTPQHFWYTHTDGCCDLFVCDTRTERQLNSDRLGRQIISREQMAALKKWLSNGSGKVKLVVTSVPFFPDSDGGERDDKWAGFEVQRKEILQHIEKAAVPKVVFCSGDVHASMSVQLLSPSGLKLLSIVSSAFFWPYPHPTARNFRLTGTIDGGSAGKFQLQNSSKVIGDDNFTRLAITPKDVTIEVFERKGALVASRVVAF